MEHIKTAEKDKCISCMHCVVKYLKGVRKVNGVMVSARKEDNMMPSGSAKRM